MSVGTFHGVNLLMEVAPEDLGPAERAWAEQAGLEGYAQVLLPEYTERRELYRYKDIHHVEFSNGIFHVGSARYLPEPRATLNVFKRRTDAFRFRFRHQLIEVRSSGEWVPSIYYYSVPEGSEGEEGIGENVALTAARRRARGRLTREVVRVGNHTIETNPRTGRWRLDGALISLQDPEEPLRLTRP